MATIPLSWNDPSFGSVTNSGSVTLKNGATLSYKSITDTGNGPVAELVGIEVGVVSGVINLESSGVEASDWRPRHDEHYHEV